MKPAWDKLGDAHADSKTVLIGDVDCTTEDNKPLCGQYGVQGYPTIKYFTSSSDPTGSKYEGGRDFEAMSKWADENLGPQCSLNNRDLCGEEAIKEMDSFTAMSADERQALIDEKDGAIKGAETALDTLLKSLQKQFEDGKKAKEDAIAAATPGLSMLRMVHKGAADNKDEL